MQRLQLASLLLVAVTALGTAAHADPVAFVVNKDSGTISVVDVTANVTRGSFSTNGTMPNSSGLHPKDAIYDAKSGRLFVAGDNRLMGYDGRVADGRGTTQTPAANSPSSLAFDEAGRRIFMSHEDLGVADGLVTEFSIADPLNPGAGVQHTVRNRPDLILVAWDPVFKRVYVVDSAGVIARTDPSGWTFASVAGAGAVRAAGIIADPVNGGVWITTRFPGRVVRVDEAGARSATDIVGTTAPAGLSWDPATPNMLAIAFEDVASILGFNTATLGRTVTLMTTFPQPVDAARTKGAKGKMVSVNRVGSKANGSVTVDGVTQAFVGEDPVALVLADVPRLFASPASNSYCYNQHGDSSEKTFAMQNTRVDRTSMNIAAPVIGGLNPLNYTITSSTCNAMSLAWGAGCSFTVRFVAQGPSVEPVSPFQPPIGGFRPPTWQAEITVAVTNDASATVRIPVRGSLNAATCPGGGPLIPLWPLR